MKKHLLFCLCFFVLCITQAFAQNRTVTGRVTGRTDGLPLPGVTVIVKGTTQGTQTDLNGNFSIAVPANDRVLVIRYIGYTSQEVTIGESNRVNVSLDADTKALSEVVITGYGSILKKDNVASTSKIAGEAVANLPVTGFDQALGGKAAGVQVNINSGIIGAPVNVRIRGVSSIASSSQPLFVIDGIPVSTADNGQLYNNANPLNDLNPNDIASIDVLKDASATSLYGSRGANGVIVITTKQGTAGQTKVSLDTYFGFNEPSKKIKVLDADQYIDINNQKWLNKNPTSTKQFAYGDYDGDGTVDRANTDWQDQAFRKGLVMNHQVSISGGDQKTVVYAGVSYQDYQNYIIINRLRKGTARINVTNNTNSWLKLGVNASYSNSLTNGLGSGTGGGYSGIPYGPLNYYPNVPVKVNGEYYLDQGGNNIGIGNIPNPLAVAYQNYDNLNNKHFLGSGFAEVTILPGLRLKTNYAVEYQDGFDYQYWGDAVGDGQGLGGLVQDVYNTQSSFDWTNSLSYNKTFGDHTINLLGVAEYNKFNSRFFYAAGIGASDPFYTEFVGSAFTTTQADGGLGSNGFNSYLASANYGYKGKYSATFSFRNDGYSGFGAAFKRGNFLSGGLGWNFSKEDFMQNISWLSEGKLRASLGETGNSTIGNFPALATYTPVTYATLGGSTLGNAGNPDLHWEKTKQFDIGLDFTLFKKLNVALDYYNKTTTALILANPTPYVLGIPGNSITQNIGSMWNKGFEVTLSSDVAITKDFHWMPNFNIAYNKNQVTSTPNHSDITQSVGIAREGMPLGSYYLIRWAGVNPQTGFAQFLDANGNAKMYNPGTNAWTNPATGAATTAISSTDRVALDKGYFPKFQGGFNNTFKYKSVDLSINLQFATNFYIYDATQQGLHSMLATNNSVDILNSWTAPGQVTDNQKLFYNDAVSTQTSTRWLEKGDFLRAQNLALGYTLPKSVSKKMNISSLRIYAAVQNAFTITGYKGTNPQTSYFTGNVNGGYSSTQGNIAGGYDYWTPYLARTFTLGLNVGF